MQEGEVCLTNIGPREVRGRRIAGTIALAAGLAGGIFLVLAHWPGEWNLALLAPFFLGFLGLLQAREKT